MDNKKHVIQGFKFVNGKFDENTAKQLAQQGAEPNLDKMFGVGHKVVKQ